MKPSELVGLIKKQEPKLLGQMPDRKVVRIIRAAFAQIGREIDALKEGVVKVPGFGNFRAREAEREKDGQKSIVKRVHFQRTQPKAGTKKRAAK